MRKEIYRMARAEAEALLGAAPVVHVAGTTEEGGPFLRTLHAVVHGGAVTFHGAPAGEKTLALGRPVVVAAEEIVASVPSYFVDAERACPATTFYRSVQVHGVLQEETDPETKAAVLQALMEKYQPEGKHVAIDAAHALYRKAVRGVMVMRVSLERLDGKTKLGQNRSPEELVRIVEQLWQRGDRGDARAVDLVREANPGMPTPPFLVAPPGVRLCCALGPVRAREAAALLSRQYWLEGVALDAIARAHEQSSAWVGAVDSGGRLVATARANADGHLHAFVYDVCVDEALRGRGLGEALVRLLLDHPSVRHARSVRLTTRDAGRLYARFGFVDVREAPLRPWPSVEMRLRRAG